MVKHKTILILALGMILSLTSCGTSPAEDVPTNPASINTETAEESASQSETDGVTVPEDAERSEEEVMEKSLHLYINETVVAVEWEDNDSVAALKELCKDAPLTIEMSMYGGNWYYFSSGGAMATSTWIGKYYVGADGKWIPGY